MSDLTAEAIAERPQGPGDAPSVECVDVSLAFDETVVLRGVSFVLPPGHLKVILGASGAGKSTILRLILGLLRPDAGEVWVGGTRVDRLSEAELLPVRSGIGMVFQEGALFDSLTVRENVGYRLYEEIHQPIEEADARVDEVLGFVGLEGQGDRMPSELSGGERRRVAIARALAPRPSLILYDEPTTGLDPITALAIDAEIVKLRDLEQVASLVVTHQLRDAFYIATHRAIRRNGEVRLESSPPDASHDTQFIMLRQGTVAFEGHAHALRETTDPYLRAFLS